MALGLWDVSTPEGPCVLRLRLGRGADEDADGLHGRARFVHAAIGRRAPDTLAAIAGLRAMLGEPPDEPRDDGAIARLQAFFAWAIRSGHAAVEPAPAPVVSTAGSSAAVDLSSLADVPPETPTPAPAPAPEPEPAADTWFEVAVVDDLGVPVAGLDIAFETMIGTEQIATDSSGVARLEPAIGTQATAAAVSLAAVRDAVFPRWSEPRTGERPAGADVVEMLVRDPLVAVALPKERRITIVLVPHIVRLRLTGMTFDNAKAFLLPDAMHGIRKLRELYEQIPDARLLVVGHTSTTGENDYNDTLSLERADSISAFVRDDVEAWYAWYGAGNSWEKRWGETEDRHMLGALPQGAGPDEAYLRGGLYASYRRFQTAHGLPESGVGDPATRRALVAEYMAQDDTSLPATAEVVTHGCGEHFPDVAPGEAEANRRVEIFVFDGPITPPPQGELSGPGATDYPAWRAQTIRTFDVATGATTVVTGSVFIRLELSAEDAALSSDRLILTGSDGYVQDKGIADAHVPSGVDGEVVDVEFTDAPIDVTYTLTATSPAGPYEVFTDVPFHALAGLGLVPESEPGASTSGDELPATAIAGIDQPLHSSVA